MAKVFISYSRRNTGQVDALVAELTRLGVPYWLDRNDIPVSVAWFDEVQAAIQESDYFLECRSPDYEASKQCQVELLAARELGKQILTRNIIEEDHRLLAGYVANLVRQCPPQVRSHTELITRAASWERAGRNRGLLISGKPLRAARSLAGHPGLRIPPQAQEFLKASRRRQRRSRRWRIGGITLVGLLVLATLVIGGVQNKIRQDTDTNVATFAALSHEPDPDVYRELRITADQSAAHHFSFLSRLPLVRALNVPLPDRSTVVAGPAPVAFTDPVVHTDAPVTTGEARREPPPPDLSTSDTRAVAHIAYAPNGKVVAVSSADDGVVRLFDLAARTVSGTVVLPAGSAPLTFSPDGRYLAAGAGPDVAIADVRTGAILTRLRGSVGTVRDLAWSADSARVWALADRGRVSSWPWRTAHVLVDDPTIWFSSVAGPSTAGEFVAVTRDGRIFRVGRTAREEARTSARDTVSSALSADGRTIAIGTQDSVVVRDSLGERTIRQDGCTPTGLAFGPSDRSLYVACGSAVLAFDVASGKQVGTVAFPHDEVNTVTTDRNGNLYAGTFYSKVVRIAPDLSTREDVLDNSCGTQIRSVRTDAAGMVVAQTGDGAGASQCLPDAVRTGQTWKAIHTVVSIDSGQQGRAVAVRADGTFAASGFSDGTVNFWAPDGALPSGNVRAFGGEVRGLAFLPDGSAVLAATRDGFLAELDACRLCRPTAELAELANQELARAKEMGLT